MKSLLALVLVSISANIFSQEGFLIENVRLFDGERVIKRTSVLVKDGKIVEVAKKISGSATQVIDGSGKTLIPALTNAHVHAWMPGNLKEAAQAGVLNLLDMHGVEMAQTMMRNYKDSTNYANYYAAGSAATAPEGHGTQYGFPAPTLTKPEEANQFIADRVNAGADYIKIIVEPWRKTLSHETVRALIEEAHKQSKIAVVHISKVEDAYKVLSNNANGLVHIWWDKVMPNEQLDQLCKDKEFFVIPTLLTSIKALDLIIKNKPELQFLSETQLKSEIKRLYDAGIKILTGTDPPNVGLNYGTDLFTEMKLINEAGLPNIDVLKGATSHVAEAFGLANQGKIQKGYLANMILINGNPLENIEDIKNQEFVWKQGKKVTLK